MLNSVLVFLDVSGGEMIVIAIVALLVLGPQKMGDFARKAGKMMSEVKRVSNDFTSQLNEETGSIQDEVRSIRETLKGAANNIKDEFNKQKAEVDTNLNPDLQPNINEPSNDVFNLPRDSSNTDFQSQSNPDGVSSEHSDMPPVSKVQPTDTNPTSKPENTTSP